MIADATHTDREEKIAERVLDMLDRWADRLNGHQDQKREFPRKRFRARVTVYIPETVGIAGESAEATNFQVWSRNLSQGGMSFIYHSHIKSDRIVVCLDPDKGGTHWYQGQLVRKRLVHNDYWEYGVKFTGTAQI